MARSIVAGVFVCWDVMHSKLKKTQLSSVAFHSMRRGPPCVVEIRQSGMVRHYGERRAVEVLTVH